jgi:hypothetical protein
VEYLTTDPVNRSFFAVTLRRVANFIENAERISCDDDPVGLADISDQDEPWAVYVEGWRVELHVSSASSARDERPMNWAS